MDAIGWHDGDGNDGSMRKKSSAASFEFSSGFTVTLANRHRERGVRYARACRITSSSSVFLEKTDSYREFFLKNSQKTDIAD